MMTEEVGCDLCGSAESNVLFEGCDRLHGKPGRFPVVQCCHCGLVYLDPRPDERLLAEYYPEDYSPFKSGTGLVDRVKEALRRQEARKIAKLLPKNGSVLEVGCAVGDLLVPLRDDQGMAVEGIEMSPHAVKAARERHGLTVHAGTVFDAPCHSEAFDAVVMRHVVEHFPSARLAMERAARFLRPGGYIFITTPNHDSLDRRIFGRFWYDYDVPRHMAVFSVETLRKLLDDTGFDVVEVTHSLVPNDWIHSLCYVLGERWGDNSRLSRFFTIENPLLLLLFLPFGLAGKFLRRSGRISVVAVRRP